ncbi:serine/threonine-protein kinase [Streptomyces sp. NPDC001478]
MTSVHDGGNGDAGGNGGSRDTGDSGGEIGGIKPLTSADPVRIGPYLLLGRLGAGGMGRVYLARSEGGRTVAVKVVHAEHVADPQFRARFRREVDAARRVGARFTAPVLDAAPDEEFPWVATGYVPGLSLEQIVRGHGPLPPATVLALADGLLRALGDIHAAGIVHRDLKPSNVMVTVDGPKVIDFGIARAVETAVESLTSTGMVIGTPGFMAPEQIRGQEAGPASDVFTLGCVLTYAATGRLPFANGVSNQHAVMYQIVEAEPELDGIDDPALRTLITRLLTKSATARPTVDALLAGLEPAAGTPAWLPAEVVGHLARQSARLLDAEAAPVREETDRGTLPLGRPGRAPTEAPPAAPDPAPVPEPVPARPAASTHPDPPKPKPAAEKRRRRLFVALPVIIVLGGGGGTLAVLQPFSHDTDTGAHTSPPSATASVTPGTPSSPPPATGTASPKGDKSPQADRTKEGAEDGKDTTTPDGGGTPSRGTTSGGGGTTGSTTTTGGGGTGGTSGGTTKPGTTTTTGGSGSGSGSGSTDGGSGGGSSSTVPASFVGTWKYGETYNINQPATVVISSNGTVRLSEISFTDCVYVGRVVSRANGGSRINVSSADLASGTPGPCSSTIEASYFTLNGSGIQHNVGPAAGDGYFYKRG